MTKLFISILLFILSVSFAFASTYHVTTSGSDSNGCTNATTDACRTPAFGASKLTTNGDILEIHTGSYSVSGSSTYTSATIYPRAANTTIRAYPGDVVTLDGGAAPTGTLIGSVSRAGTIIEGLTIKGVVLIWYSPNVTIRNCNISVGGDDDSVNTIFDDLIFVQGGDGALIQNNILHDNPHTTAESPLNRSQIMVYDTDNITIEYNTFYNSSGNGIYLKGNPIQGAIVRYNYFHSNYSSAIALFGEYSPGGIANIYNNVFRNNDTGNDDDNGSGSLLFTGCGSVNYYNNTIVHPDNQSGVSINRWCNDATGSLNVWNNISYTLDQPHWRISYSGGISSLDYIDYNSYSTSADWYSYTQGTMTFSGWKSYVSSNGASGADANSNTSNPDFPTPSGTNVYDYRLQSSSPTALKSGGRGGAYNTYMGAWDPNSSGTWVGYCSSGVGGCNVTGLSDGSGGGDTTPPVISGQSPSGEQTCTVNPRDVTLSVNTNEAATCRMATSNIAYDSMTDVFTTTGGTTHSETKSLSCNTSYTYYVRCVDSAGNKNTSSAQISFSISTEVVPPDFITGTRFGENSGADVLGTCSDTYLNSGAPTENKSTEVILSTYTWPINTSANTIILKFDLSTIPSGATITDAKLYLYQTEAGGDTTYSVTVHRISGDDPVVTQTTWNVYSTGNSWGATLGGRGDVESAESTNNLDSTTGWKYWDVDIMVAGWVAGTFANKGMLIDSDTVAAADSYRYFASSQNSDAAIRPMLIIDYSVPAPANRTVTTGGSQTVGTSGSHTISW